MNKNRHLNSITIKYNGVEYRNTAVIEVGSEKTVLPILVGVNGSYENNDFNIIYDNHLVSHKRIRNIVDIIISPTIYDDRNMIIAFTHKLNSAIRFELEIRQKAPDYQIQLSSNGVNYTNSITLQFQNLTGKTDGNKIERTVNINCQNGKAFISAIKEYALIDTTSTEYVKVKYDNGLELHLNGDELKIVNHGKANMYYNHYYIIVIKNKLDIYKEATIRIKYKKETDTFSIQ